MDRLARHGVTDLAWSAAELDAGLDEIETGWEAAGRPEQYGWTTLHELDYKLLGYVEAPTHRSVTTTVEDLAVAELEAAGGHPPFLRGAEDIQNRWGVVVDVHPPGYEPRSFATQET